MQLDFKVLGDGVIKNNMGLGGITLTADAEIVGGEVKLLPSGQTFPLSGAAPAEPGAGLRKLTVIAPREPEKTALDPQD